MITLTHTVPHTWQGSDEAWDSHIRPAMTRQVIMSLQSAQDQVSVTKLPSLHHNGTTPSHTRLPSPQVEHRGNTCEVYGFDFMVDEFLNPWVIEVNSNPDFSYSTAVTKQLVKAAGADIAKVIVDLPAANLAARRSDSSSGGATTGWGPVRGVVAADTGGWRLVHADKHAASVLRRRLHSATTGNRRGGRNGGRFAVYGTRLATGPDTTSWHRESGEALPPSTSS